MAPFLHACAVTSCRGSCRPLPSAGSSDQKAARAAGRGVRDRPANANASASATWCCSGRTAARAGRARGVSGPHSLRHAPNSIVPFRGFCSVWRLYLRGVAIVSESPDNQGKGPGFALTLGSRRTPEQKEQFMAPGLSPREARSSGPRGGDWGKPRAPQERVQACLSPLGGWPEALCVTARTVALALREKPRRGRKVGQGEPRYDVHFKGIWLSCGRG